MNFEDEIRKAIRKIIGEPKVQVQEGTVESVNWDKRSCVVKLSDGRKFFDVRLRAVVDDSKNGLCLKPKVNSAVLVNLIENQEMNAYVSGFTDVEAIELEGESDVDVIFNKGNNDGVVKVKEVVKKLNVIEKDLNKVKTAFQTALNTIVNEPGNGAPSAFQTALKAALLEWDGAQLTETQQDDLENTKFKH